MKGRRLQGLSGTGGWRFVRLKEGYYLLMSKLSGIREWWVSQFIRLVGIDPFPFE